MWSASRQTLILRGLITIAFGVALLLWPGISLELLILLFGVFALVDGALVLATAIQARSTEPGYRIAIIAGALAMVVGTVTLLWPSLTALAVLVLIALRALVIGVAELATAERLRGQGSGAWVLAALGLVSITFGVFLLVYPGTGLLAMVWAIGLYAMLIGFIGIGRAWAPVVLRNA
jgi:uncharacterized membrane protein HdeD (DUF308 family)